MGTTSNCLWWALNGVSLQFAWSKCGTTVRESPYTDMILLWVLSISREYWVYWTLLAKNLEISDFWVWVWGIEIFHRSKFSPATGVSDFVWNCYQFLHTEHFLFFPIRAIRTPVRAMRIPFFFFKSWAICVVRTLFLIFTSSCIRTNFFFQFVQ